ncbi:MAG: nucleoside triphosphate pyrophosphohydrolase family protein [Pararhodobacter sp.]|nr:nucleoside triphosphate pyrophosphohydrolase family protein [Pararhodobacter sp.]
MRSSLLLTEYQQQAQRTDLRRVDNPDITFPLLGLFGETGSLLSEVKKKQRDQVAYIGYEDSVLEELGDVLWYLAAVSSRANLGLDELAVNLDKSLGDWQSARAPDLCFDALQAHAFGIAATPSPAFERRLVALAGEVGLLMTDHYAGRLERNRSTLKGRLIAVLRALRDATHEAGLTLEAAANANLEKIFDRWPAERHHPSLFDEAFPQNEQLPRHFIIDIEEIEVEGRTMARLSRNGTPLGDPLTDNREDDDDYRFHDVFHLSFAAHLGWSPTLRRLLKIKRKSNPKTDEVQDGARAVLIEEGIATWIFNHAQRLEFFEGIDALDYGLLKSVRNFVVGYEVEQCPLWLWEEAILAGYKIFREVRTHRGGRVGIDLTKRCIWFEAP